MDTQTELKRMSEHITSTVDLLMEVFEAQKIPHHVATVAMAEAIFKVAMLSCKDFGEFRSLMKLTMIEMYIATPKFIAGKLAEAMKDKNPTQKTELILKWALNGPEDVKIKDGKVVL